MTNEELILERLARIEDQLAPLVQTARSVKELKDDLAPLGHQAIKLLIHELEDVESSFQLEDLLVLAKRMMRSVNDIVFALNQLQSIIDFVTTIEPLIKSAVPQFIRYLDDLEQKGVLRVIQAMLDVRAKVALAYTADDIDKIGDGAVALLGLAKKVTSPQAIAFLEKIAEVPGKVDLTTCKPTGPFGLLSASSSKEVKEGLGILIELTKAIGKLKSSNCAELAEPIEGPSSVIPGAGRQQ